MNAPADARPAQCADAVLMVRPGAFGANPETAATNAFQQPGAADDSVRRAALAEFDALAAALDTAGVEVIVLDDAPEPPSPDAVFPNNWLSFHHDGTVVLYPMLSPLRRLERREEAPAAVRARGFEQRRLVDLTGWEGAGRFLEGTGSLVLDHVGRVAYACESPRTAGGPLEEFCTKLGYAPHRFTATGPAGEPLYHTNVMMCVGESFVAACLEAVPHPIQRDELRARLGDSGRELVALGRGQMNAFAGNLLGLATRNGERVIALSATAWGALAPAQQRVLERHGAVVPVPVPTIERFGGGSVRCMLAEVFLPRRGASVPAAAGS